LFAHSSKFNKATIESHILPTNKWVDGRMTLLNKHVYFIPDMVSLLLASFMTWLNAHGQGS